MGSLKNKILISMPHMIDPYFSKSVIYICEHNMDGGMGLMINKQFKPNDIIDVFDKLSIGDNKISELTSKLFFGGPVLLDRGIVLHNKDYKTKETINISDNFSITSQKDVLTELKNKPDTPFKLILGHCGWASGQLEKEIENGDWLIQSTTEDFIFRIKPEEMWQHAARSLGLNVSLSTGISGQA